MLLKDLRNVIQEPRIARLEGGLGRVLWSNENAAFLGSCLGPGAKELLTLSDLLSLPANGRQLRWPSENWLAEVSRGQHRTLPRPAVKWKMSCLEITDTRKRFVMRNRRLRLLISFLISLECCPQ